ncbi:hypothetical protein V8E53_003648 [Lactarius tabidus]
MTTTSSESFGVSDAGFPSLYRVSTAAQYIAASCTALHQRSVSRGSHDTREVRALSIPRAAHTLSDMIGIQDPPISLSPWSPSVTILRPKTFTRKQATTFLFLLCFIFFYTGSGCMYTGERGSQGGSLTCLVIFYFVFHIRTAISRACSGRWGECPVAAEITVSLYRSSIIDHRVAADQSPDRSTDTYKADTRRTGHHRCRQQLAPSFCPANSIPICS